MKIIENKKFKDLKKGDLIQIRSYEEIKKTLNDRNEYDNTRFTNIMKNTICSKIFKISSDCEGGKVKISNENNIWVIREPWIIIL